jgi:hypothetical protein
MNNNNHDHFHHSNCSLFDLDVEAYINSINVVGAMGAGIALEFKNRYPHMFKAYQEACLLHEIAPGDCWSYYDEASKKYLLNVAVKRDWREWATKEWLEQSVKSLKLMVLEKNIKSIALPLICGKNARRGPRGPVPGYTEPPYGDVLLKWLTSEMTSFADRFEVDVHLCTPPEAGTIKVPKSVLNMASEFFHIK